MNTLKSTRQVEIGDKVQRVKGFNTPRFHHSDLEEYGIYTIRKKSTSTIVHFEEIGKGFSIRHFKKVNGYAKINENYNI